MPRTKEKNHTLLGLGLVFGVGFVSVLGFRSAFKDGRGETNFSIGPIKHGTCIEVLESPDIHHPETDAKLLSTVQAIGRACGFCLQGQALSNGGVDYNLCVDPETIETTYNGVDMTTGIVGYLTTEPAGAPEGYIYAALDANPGFCASVLSGIQDEMNTYFSRAFDEETQKSISAVVRISVGSNSTCEASALTTTSAG